MVATRCILSLAIALLIAGCEKQQEKSEPEVLVLSEAKKASTPVAQILDRHTATTKQRVREVESNMAAHFRDADLGDLLSIFAAPDVPPEPAATAAEISATAKRIGAPLPADLVRFLEIANGDLNVGIYPIEAWRPVGAQIDELAESRDRVRVRVSMDGSDAVREIAVDTLRDHWVIGGDDSGWLLYAFDEPSLPGKRLVESWAGSFRGHNGLRDYVEWRAAEALRRSSYEVLRAQLRQQLSKEAEALDWDAAVREAREVGRTYLTPPFSSYRPGPASAVSIASFTSRMGRPLSPSLHQIYRRSNGIPTAGLLPVEFIHVMGDPMAAHFLPDQTARAMTRAGMTRHVFSFSAKDPAALKNCWVLAQDDMSVPMEPFLVYCPGQRRPVLELAEGLAFFDMREWLNDHLGRAWGAKVSARAIPEQKLAEI